MLIASLPVLDDVALQRARASMGDFGRAACRCGELPAERMKVALLPEVSPLVSVIEPELVKFSRRCCLGVLADGALDCQRLARRQVAAQRAAFALVARSCWRLRQCSGGRVVNDHRLGAARRAGTLPERRFRFEEHVATGQTQCGDFAACAVRDRAAVRDVQLLAFGDVGRTFVRQSSARAVVGGARVDRQGPLVRNVALQRARASMGDFGRECAAVGERARGKDEGCVLAGGVAVGQRDRA